MSRSYKKTPICKDRKTSSKANKRIANSKVRHTDNIPNGKAYRKVFNTWDIHDYVSRYSYEEYMVDFYRDLKEYRNGISDESPFDDKRRFNINDWFKCYRRK